MSPPAPLFARAWIDGEPRYLRLEADRTVCLTAAPWDPDCKDDSSFSPLSLEALDPDRAWMTPCDPRTILCVGRNYVDHAKELGNVVPAEPLLFLKPWSSLLAPFGTVLLPPSRISTRIEHEAEVALVVGKTLFRPTLDEAADAIFGITLAADITARDIQRSDKQWTRGKGMATFCPLGPAIATGIDPMDVRFTARVNGALRQQGHTADMVFPAAEILRYAAETIRLVPGDIVLTGTPEGVGPLASGDVLELESPCVGTLRVVVARDEPKG